MRTLSNQEIVLVCGGNGATNAAPSSGSTQSGAKSAQDGQGKTPMAPDSVDALTDEQVRDLCVFGASVGGGVVGGTAGWAGGAGLGGLVGGALGSVVPGLGTVAGTAVGITAGGTFGARAGAWAGGALGTIGGIVFCPPGGG
jgi:hypothetical protein